MVTNKIEPAVEAKIETPAVKAEVTPLVPTARDEVLTATNALKLIVTDVNVQFKSQIIGRIEEIEAFLRNQ